MLTVLKWFDYDVENLNGAKVHSLFNVVTLSNGADDQFDRMEAWFEATVRFCYMGMWAMPAVLITAIFPTLISSKWLIAIASKL